MGILSWLAVFVGGGLGSMLRFGISQYVSGRIPIGKLPVATVLTNILACVAMALLIHFFSQRQQLNSLWAQMWLIGFCGGFSTFSTFSYENFTLLQQESYLWLIANVVISVLLCLLVFIILSRDFSAAA